MTGIQQQTALTIRSVGPPATSRAQVVVTRCHCIGCRCYCSVWARAGVGAAMAAARSSEGITGEGIAVMAVVVASWWAGPIAADPDTMAS